MKIENEVKPTWNFAAKPWESPAAQTGQGGVGDKGKKGDDGKNHWDSGSTQNVCDTAPKNGGQGGDGKTPDTAPKAQDGRPAAIITQNLGLCRGEIIIHYGAGDGQKGSKGGTGGDGGPGGDPGTCPSGCTAAKTGDQGVGGKGGNGGEGGNGGVTGLITIFYADGGATFTVTQVGCGGGDGGDPGDPGKGTGTRGGGSTGKPGTASKPPVININKR